MKKIWLTMAGSLLIALAVNAQERSDTTTTDPSTGYREESGVQGNTETLEGKSGTQGQYAPYWRREDQESISREDLPDGLLETLESSEYSGWENATIYRNKMTDDYMLIIQDQGSPKTFYFDKEGQALDSKAYSDVPESDQSSNNMREDDDQGNEVDQSNADRNRTDDMTVQPGNDQSANETSDSQEESVELQTTGPIPATSWRAEDKIIIVADDIPASLRITLEDDKYKGCQNSTLYKNRTTGEYMIEVRDGSNTKVFYFDKEGKVLSNPGNND